MEINEADREVMEIHKNFDNKKHAYVKIAHTIPKEIKLLDCWPVDQGNAVAIRAHVKTMGGKDGKESIVEEFLLI